METTKRLTNLQRELIKIFSYDLSDNQLDEIRNLLSKYFAQKATTEMDKIWNINNLTNETMDNWTKEHLRTKYN